jgi:hypothetical protein
MQVPALRPPAGVNGAAVVVAHPVAPGQRADTPRRNAAAWTDVARFLVEQRYPGISSRLLTV